MKTISRDDYLKTVGLLTLAQSYAKKAGEAEAALGELLDCQEGQHYFGHASDAVWEGHSADEMLRRMKVEVAE